MGLLWTNCLQESPVSCTRILLFVVVLGLVVIGPPGVTSWSSSGLDMSGKVVYGVNAGGSAYTDGNGVFYEADSCQEGISSDYGKRFWTIGRVDPDDSILYQTERYSMSTFGYQIPVKDDGDYVLVLKFSEVYFLNPQKKVFDVVLNNAHVIVKNLDIFKEVGHAVALDLVIPFSISNGGEILDVAGSQSPIKKRKIQLQFIKGPLDNPKINAFYVIKGKTSDVPELPPYEPTMETVGEDSPRSDEEDDEFNLDEDALDGGHDHREEETELSPAQKRRRRLLRQPSVLPTYQATEGDDWTPVFQISGSIAIAVIVVVAVKKILS